MEDIRNWNVDC